MRTATSKRIDFEFVFEGCFNESLAESKEGLKAKLSFEPYQEEGDKFTLEKNDEILDKSSINRDGRGLDLELWEIDHDGTDRFLGYNSARVYGTRSYIYDPIAKAYVRIPTRFWLTPGKRVKISMWIPYGSFLGNAVEIKESIAGAPSVPEIEKFEKIPLDEALLSDRVPTDFTLVSEKDGEGVKCHQCILYVSGEFFQKIIDNSLDPENKRNSSALPFSGKTLELIKRYIYSRKISFKEEDDMEEVVNAGTMMMFPGLVEESEKYIMEKLNSKDKYDMLVLARRFGLKRLKAKIFPLATKDAEFREKMRRNKDPDLLVEFNEYLADKV